MSSTLEVAPPEAGGQVVFDVFLSHNSQDKALVERIATHLRRMGLRPWLDAQQLVDEWHAPIHEEVARARGCAIFLGPHGWGKWQEREAEVADSCHVEDPAYRVIPVLLPGVANEVLATLPRYLRRYRYVDFRAGGLDDEDRLQELRCRVLGISLDQAQPDADVELECPYRGLQAFDAEHADNFYGREADVDRLLDKLRTSRFLAILGASGSGKSSVVRAGLIPRLQAGALPGSASWKVQVLRPGRDPLKALAEAATLLSAHQSVHKTLDELASDARALDGVSGLIHAQDLACERVVWVIDQAEEIFTLCDDSAKRAQFLANLVDAATAEDGRAVVVLTLRTEFYANCVAYPDFSHLIEDHQAQIGALDRAGLRRAIVEPAGKLGITFESGLVDTILQDVLVDGEHQQPGALPLLQYALTELWHRREAGHMTLSGYRSVGGVAGALAKRATEVYQTLDAEEQPVARATLLQLVKPEAEFDATSRRAALRELVPNEALRPVTERVVQELAAARLITTDRQANEVWVNVAHEALIRNWDLLRGWIKENREWLELLHKLQDAERDWEASGRTDEDLWRGARLAQAVEWRPRYAHMLSPGVEAFLQASVALRDREERAELARAQEKLANAHRIARANRWLRSLAAVLTLAVVGALAFGGLALREQDAAQQSADQAQRSADQAQRASVQAHARQLAAESLNVTSVSPDLAALLGIQASTLLPDDPEVLASLLTGAVANPRLAVTLRGHTDAVRDVAVSPDGTQIASASNDGTLRLWRAHSNPVNQMYAADGAPLTVDGHTANISTLVFSPDGGRLFSASGDGSVRTWDAHTLQALGGVLKSTDTGGAPVAALSPDGRRLVTGGSDGSVRLWDAATLAPLGPQQAGHAGHVLAVAFSPDGNEVASVGEDDHELRLWSAATGEPLANPLHKVFTPTLAFAPDGHALASAELGATIRFVDPTTGAPLGQPLALPRGEIALSLAYSPDSRLLASLDADTATLTTTLRLWDLATGSGSVVAPGGHPPSLVPNSVAFSPDGTLLADTSDGELRLWDVQGARATRHAGPPMGAGLPSGAALAFSPDGSRLAAGGQQPTVMVWDLATGAALQSAAGQAAVTGVAYAPDGAHLASASEDGAVRIWDATSRQLTATLWPPTVGTLSAVAWSRDGKTLAAGGAAGVSVWDMTTSPAHLVRLECGEQAECQKVVATLAFSPDNGLLATAGADKLIRLWNVSSGRLEREWTAADDASHGVRSLAFSPDGKLLASGAEPELLQVWDVATGQPHYSQPVTRGSAYNTLTGIYRVAFSPSGLLAASTAGGDVRLWQLADGGPVEHRPLTGQGGLGTALAFWPGNADWLVSGSTNHSLVVWDLQGWPPTVHVSQAVRGGLIQAVAFSPDGSRVATANADHTVRLWDTSARPVGDPYQEHADVVRGVAYSPDGTRLVSAGLDGKVLLRDASSGAVVAQLTTSDAPTPRRYLSVAISSANLVAAGTQDGSIVVWDASSGQTQPLRTIQAGGGSTEIRSVAFNPDGSVLASGSGGQQPAVRLWSMPSGAAIGSPMADRYWTGVWSVAFSPDGETLATGSADGLVRFWDVASQAIVKPPYPVHTGPVQSVAFSPDGQLVASGSSDGSIRLWNVATGLPVGASIAPEPVSGTPGAIYSVAFRPDGKQLASGGAAEVLGLWDVEANALRKASCDRAGRNFVPSEWATFVGAEPYQDTCPAIALAQAVDAARGGRSSQASGDFARISHEAAATTDADLNNAVCWLGNLYGPAAQTLPSCERAVQLFPPDSATYVNARDSRGVARALTGNPAGALEDFESFLGWAQQHPTPSGSQYTSVRQHWVDELRAGRNPFDDPATLEALRQSES